MCTFTFYILGTQAVAVLCQGHGHETSISNIHYIGRRLVGIWHTYIDNCSQSLGAQRNSWIFLLSKEYPILKAQCHNLTQWCFRECYVVRRGYFSRLCASLSRLKSYLFPTFIKHFLQMTTLIQLNTAVIKLMSWLDKSFFYSLSIG